MTANQFSTSSEREALCGFLDKQRADLLRKLDGVSDVGARMTPTVSSLSLMGLLKHSALWERRWFQIVVAGRVLPGEWTDVEVRDWRDEDRSRARPGRRPCCPGPDGRWQRPGGCRRR
ncbi:DUF664 domain-containing protein [Streptomyces prunicolor]|uniref:mycothiol transferase n=1 Tax=Streptomyces prunicolor TaxID=67348 RepID=UPI00343707CA